MKKIKLRKGETLVDYAERKSREFLAMEKEMGYSTYATLGAKTRKGKG